jgi:hypothetical protein
MFQDLPRRFDVFEEFWMRWRKRVTCNIVHDCAVEERLFRAMDGGVVRQAGVMPWDTVTVSNLSKTKPD